MKFSPHHSTLNYFHWDSGDGTAVFAFEACTNDDDEHPSRVVRQYRDQKLLHEDAGRSLGHGPGQTCALLVKGGPGDLITIYEANCGNSSVQGDNRIVGYDPFPSPESSRNCWFRSGR